MLVTGAAGFIGRAACVQLIRAQFDVVGTCRRSPSPAVAGVEWIQADLRYGGAIRRMPDVSAVLHLAARLPKSFAQSLREAEWNARIDETVFSLVTQRPVPVVFASTGSLYRKPPPPSGWKEDDVLDPRGAYLIQKAAAEKEAHRLAASGVPVTVLRINAPYGPDQRVKTVIQLFLDQARRGGPVTYFGQGSRQQDFTHVTDVAEACLAAIRKPGGTFNIAGGEPVTMFQLATLIAEVAKLGDNGVRQLRKADPQEGTRVKFDLSSTRTALGWTAATPLLEGVRLCYESGGGSAR